MQSYKEIFPKILKSKTAILATMICFIIIYAIISVIILFANDSDIFSIITKIAAPLGIIGTATVLSVDCFYKMASDKTAVKTLGLITLILGLVDMILAILMIWEIIPAYEKTTYSLYGYFSSYYLTPTISYKITLSLTSVIGFTFLSSIVLNTKDNYKLIQIPKYLTTGLLAVASIVSVANNFMDFSKDQYSSVRMGILQAILWVTAIALGATVFYLSKTTEWEKDKNSPTGSIDPPAKQPVEEQPIAITSEEESNEETVVDMAVLPQHIDSDGYDNSADPSQYTNGDDYNNINQS